METDIESRKGHGKCACSMPQGLREGLTVLDLRAKMPHQLVHGRYLNGVRRFSK